MVNPNLFAGAPGLHQCQLHPEEPSRDICRLPDTYHGNLHIRAMLLYTDSVLWTIFNGLELFLILAVLLYAKLCVSKPYKQLPSEGVSCAIVSTSQSLSQHPSL